MIVFHCKCWQYLHSPCVVPGLRQLFGSQLFQQQQLQPKHNSCFISTGIAVVSVSFAKQLRIGRFQGALVLSGQLSTCYMHIVGFEGGGGGFILFEQFVDKPLNRI